MEIKLSSEETSNKENLFQNQVTKIKKRGCFVKLDLLLSVRPSRAGNVPKHIAFGPF